MLTDNTIAKRVTARIKSKIAAAQKRFEEGKKKIRAEIDEAIDSLHAAVRRAEADRAHKIERLASEIVDDVVGK